MQFWILLVPNDAASPTPPALGLGLSPDDNLICEALQVLSFQRFDSDLAFLEVASYWRNLESAGVWDFEVFDASDDFGLLLVLGYAHEKGNVIQSFLRVNNSRHIRNVGKRRVLDEVMEIVSISYDLGALECRFGKLKCNAKSLLASECAGSPEYERQKHGEKNDGGEMESVLHGST